MMTRRRPLEPLRPGARRACGRCGALPSPPPAPPPAPGRRPGAGRCALRRPAAAPPWRLRGCACVVGRGARRGAALRDRGEALAAGRLRLRAAAAWARGAGAAPPPLKARAASFSSTLEAAAFTSRPAF